ncbi:MAG: hypothetical protein QXP84_07625 [Candidatus Korarchaeum sp.]
MKPKIMPSTALKELEKSLLKLLSTPHFIYYKSILTELVVASRPLSLKALTEAVGFEYPQKTYYYAEKLANLSLIKKITQNRRIFYVSTEISEYALKFFYLKSSRGMRTHETSTSRRPYAIRRSDRPEISNPKISVRLHSFSLSSNILQEGEDPSEQRKTAKLRNWTIRYYYIPTPLGYVTAKVTTRKVIFTAPPISDEPEEAERKAIKSIEHAIKVFQEFGWRLGPPQLTGKPHWGVKAKQLPPFNLLAKSITVQNDVGSIDSSCGEEVELYEEDPLVAKRALMAFVSLPERLTSIDMKISALEQATAQLASSFERFLSLFHSSSYWECQYEEGATQMPY